ncbi:hypothetical protein [Cryptosporangium arvum]|uniref:ABC transporter n=1 Tax=Cryptosporangium arvum DSM 44712 TaxID=927661 RepID=A0A010ZVF9_9ACTN|nr:hypothetical protein [Cryptosporangium arvum]EXG81192.1 hypothetical protein CryarDRAFT_2300 [Cryptosporangium arvum DSM 44712]
MTIHRLLAAAVATLTLAACADATEPAAEATPGAAAGATPGAAAEATPHGYVAGAEELPEPRPALAYATRGADRLHLLDLTDETEKHVDLRIGAQRLVEDGRFVYVDAGDGRLEIVDAGVWTVDHSDHVHYYRAPARSLGVLTLDAPVTTIAGAGASTAISTTGGRVVVLDRRKLESGEIVERTTLPTAALAVPYADALLVATGGRVVATDARGRRTGDLAVPCAAPRGWAALRGGVVIACERSVVRVKQRGGKLTATTLPAPGAPLPSSGFTYRPRGNEAATTDGTGIWTVDAAKATLRRVPGRRDLTAVAPPADGATVLALATNGTVTSVDLNDGTVLATAAVRGASLTLDVDRAYLTEPRARAVHELDYRDGLRTARTLRVRERPDLAVEVGR